MIFLQNTSAIQFDLVAIYDISQSTLVHVSVSPRYSAYEMITQERGNSHKSLFTLQIETPRDMSP